MKNIILAISLLILISSNLIAEESILGFWRSTVSSKGGMTGILEFKDNEIMISHVSLMWDSRYKLDGDKLTEKPISDKEGAEAIYTISFKENTLIMKSPECGDIILTRMDNQKDTKANQGIIGKWAYVDSSAKELIYCFAFTPDGFLYRSLPMPASVTNKYSIKGNSIEISQENKKLETSKWHIKEEILTLILQDEKEYTYKHISGDILFLTSDKTSKSTNLFLQNVTKSERFYELDDEIKSKYNENKFEEVKILCEEYLLLSEKFKSDWNYGNAIHHANLYLGSPQLDSFGPNMLLAKELLEKEEKEVVFEYINKLRKFWQGNHVNTLNQWENEIKSNKIPDFGANLE